MKYLILLLPLFTYADTLSWDKVTGRENGELITGTVTYVVYKDGAEHAQTTELSIDVGTTCKLVDWSVKSLIDSVYSGDGETVVQPSGDCRPKPPTGLKFL